MIFRFIFAIFCILVLAYSLVSTVLYYATHKKTEHEDFGIKTVIGIIGLACVLITAGAGIAFACLYEDTIGSIILIAVILICFMFLGMYLVGYAYVRSFEMKDNIVCYRNVFYISHSYDVREISKIKEVATSSDLTGGHKYYSGNKKIFSMDIDDEMVQFDMLDIINKAKELGHEIEYISSASKAEDIAKRNNGIVVSRINIVGFILAGFNFAFPIITLCVLGFNHGVYSLICTTWLIFGVIYLSYCISYKLTFDSRSGKLTISKFFREKSYNIYEYKRKAGYDENDVAQTKIIFYKKNQKQFKVDVSITVTNRAYLIKYLM